jgi:hypothetical protein
MTRRQILQLCLDLVAVVVAEHLPSYVERHNAFDLLLETFLHPCCWICCPTRSGGICGLNTSDTDGVALSMAGSTVSAATFRSSNSRLMDCLVVGTMAGELVGLTLDSKPVRTCQWEIGGKLPLLDAMFRNNRQI